MAEGDDRTRKDATGEDQANVGRRERPTVGRSERRIDAATRPSVEMEHEVAQRASAPPDAHAPIDEPSHDPASLAGKVPPGPQTSGYREDRENPAAGLGALQTGEHQSQELPSAGLRRPRAQPSHPSRPSRPSRESADRVSRPSS